jgi:hypothetical protein
MQYNRPHFKTGIVLAATSLKMVLIYMKSRMRRGQTSPLGANFTPGGKLHPWGKTSPPGANHVFENWPLRLPKLLSNSGHLAFAAMASFFTKFSRGNFSIRSNGRRSSWTRCAINIRLVKSPGFNIMI